PCPADLTRPTSLPLSREPLARARFHRLRSHAAVGCTRAPRVCPPQQTGLLIPPRGVLEPQVIRSTWLTFLVVCATTRPNLPLHPRPARRTARREDRCWRHCLAARAWPRRSAR